MNIVYIRIIYINSILDSAVCLCDNIGLVALLLLGWELRASSITVLCVQAVMILSPLLFMPSLYSHSNSKNFYITCIYTVRPTGYLNVSTRFFFTATCRHFTGHNTALTGQGKPHEPGFSKEERERRATESDETREARLRRTPERASCF